MCGCFVLQLFAIQSTGGATRLVAVLRGYTSSGSFKGRIVDNGALPKSVHQRYFLELNSNGTYNIHIRNAQLSDVGWYAFIEESGAGLKAQIHLNVVEGKLSCRSSSLYDN